MKKFFNLLLSLSLFVSVSNTVFATCSTGFACQISEIETLYDNKNDEFLLAMNNYFDKKINEDIFFGKIPSSVNYNDLFLFNTVF